MNWVRMGEPMAAGTRRQSPLVPMPTTVTTHSNDGDPVRRTEVKTHIHWQAIPEGVRWRADHIPLAKRDYWRHMSKLDQGIKKGRSWFDGSLITNFHNSDLIRLFTDVLELRPVQAKRVEDYFLAQDLRRWGIRKELVAWATCAYVVHSDDRDERRCHPEVTKDADESFLDLAFDLDLTHRDCRKTYGKVQSDFQRNWTGGI